MSTTKAKTIHPEDVKYIKRELEDLRSTLRELEDKHLPALDNVSAAAKVLAVAIEQAGNGLSELQDEMWDKIRNIENALKVLD